jgi:hypothetical protein
LLFRPFRFSVEAQNWLIRWWLGLAGVVVVDSVVGLADLGLIFCVPGDFLPISLPAWWWLTA